MRNLTLLTDLYEITMAFINTVSTKRKPYSIFFSVRIN